MTKKEMRAWMLESIEQAIERIEREEHYKLTGWVTVPANHRPQG